MRETAVSLLRDGPVGTLRLERPQVENAVDASTMDALERHLATIEADDGLRVLMLTGAGTKTFCAGGDLRYFASLRTREAVRTMSLRMQAILRRLYAGPRPVVAALGGDAWGGGCEVLTACHLRIAADHARFGFRHAAIGMVPGWGGGERLYRLVGPAVARRLLLTADTIDAPEALRLGLVDRVVPGRELETAAHAWAARIAGHDPDSIRALLALDRDHARALGDDDARTARATDRFVDCWFGARFQRQLATWGQRSRRAASVNDSG